MEKRENGFERWENKLKCSSNRKTIKIIKKSYHGQKWERSNHGRGQWSLPNFMTWTIWNHKFSTWVWLNPTINRTVPSSYRRFPDHLITASQNQRFSSPQSVIVLGIDFSGKRLITKTLFSAKSSGYTTYMYCHRYHWKCFLLSVARH